MSDRRAAVFPFVTLPDGYHCLIRPLIEFRRDRREAVFLFVRLPD